MEVMQAALERMPHPLYTCLERVLVTPWGLHLFERCFRPSIESCIQLPLE